MQEHRIQEVREMLQDHLHPGEEFRVRWQDDRLDVTPLQGHSSLVHDESELYGLLMTVNERISNAGTGLAFFGLGATLFAILALALDWFEIKETQNLRNWWVYVLMASGGLVVTGWLTGLQENAAFRASERELERALDQARLSRYTLLTMIKDDDELDSLTELLKKTPAKK